MAATYELDIAMLCGGKKQALTKRRYGGHKLIFLGCASTVKKAVNANSNVTSMETSVKKTAGLRRCPRRREY